MQTLGIIPHQDHTPAKEYGDIVRETRMIGVIDSLVPLCENDD
jgi:hypothetical protein